MALQTVFDPEIPVNIYDLGSIYRIDVINRCDIGIDITLTVAGLSGRR
ncbi:MAG: iron-sulfur cluster assembly protein [Methylocystis sp.]